MTALTYSLGDVQRTFSHYEISKAKEYLRPGVISDLRVSPNGRAILALVQGTRRQPYRVSIQLDGRSRQNGPMGVTGYCTCPVMYNCKHVAAVLLAVLGRAGAAGAPSGQAEDSERGPLTAWLNTLDEVVAAPNPEEYPPAIRHRLLYVLSLRTLPRFGHCLTVEPHSVQLLKNGGFSVHQSTLRADTVVNSSMPAAYLRKSDLFIMRSLWAQHGSYFPYATYPIQDETGRELLERILRTGRAHWQATDGMALTLAPSRAGEPVWIAEPDGTQRFRFTLEEPADVVWPLEPPWYLDTRTGQCGPIATDLTPHLASSLLSAPAVPPTQADWLRRELARRLPEKPALQPASFGETIVKDVAPVPCLRIVFRTFDEYDPLELAYDDDRWDAGLQDYISPAGGVVGRLSFDYGGLRVDTDVHDDELTAVENGRLLVVPRRRQAEAAADKRLSDLGFVQVDRMPTYGMPIGEPGDRVLMTGKDDGQWLSGPLGPMLNFLYRDAPALEAEGWRIEVDERIPFRLAEPDDDWTAEIEDGGSGIDWFGLSLGVTVDSQKVDLVPVLLPLLKALPEDGGLGLLDELDATGQVLFAPMEDGRILPLPVERVRPLLVALYDLYRVGGIDETGAIRISAARLAELAELEAASKATSLRWVGGSRLLEIGRRLRDIGSIAPVPPPAGLKASLRPYQQQGLDWLQFLRSVELGGILADDMGLGKTVQALAHILTEKEAGRLDRPCLVVAPTSLMANWRREAGRFAPDLSVLTLHGAGRKAEFERVAEHDLVLTTYPLLPRDKDALLAREWHMVLLDEAQAIKNPKAQATLVALQLRARHRVCLTGTPLENNLEELWSLFHFLTPGLLGDQRQFKRVFRTPIEKQGNEERQHLLARRVRPFLLRRTKAEVAGDLPEKTEIVETIELEGPQRDLYESIRVAMDARVRAEIAAKGLARSHIMILDALLKLRQACCDPRLLKVEGAAKVKGSAKLQRLMEMLPELVAEGRRVLVFSQFTSMLGLIETELGRHGIKYVKLTGQTRDRKTPVDRFQAGEVPVFLISLKAGGTGLNLTAADTVILYDPWWNPAAERQAMDRAHRIGQDKAVFVYKMMTAGTVEEAILTLQARKQALADGLFDPDAGTGAALTVHDIDLLFQPLGSM